MGIYCLKRLSNVGYTYIASMRVWVHIFSQHDILLSHQNPNEMHLKFKDTGLAHHILNTYSKNGD